VVVAQQANGIIRGAVSDATGTMVAAAEVSAVNDSTGYTRTVNTRADGSYAFTELPPGHYHVKVTKEGFKKEGFKTEALRPLMLSGLGPLSNCGGGKRNMGPLHAFSTQSSRSLFSRANLPRGVIA
jgi:hypothetical protein